MQPARGRPYGFSTVPAVASHHVSPSAADARSLEDVRNPPYVRENMGSRGRVPGPSSNLSPANTTQQPGQVASPRSQSSAAATRSPSGVNGGLERRPSATHGQLYTSKNYGGYQHSRNTSFVNSPSTSPLSPQIIGSTSNGAGVPPEFSSLNSVQRQKDPGSNMTSGFSPSTSSAGDRDVFDTNASLPTQKRVDRAHSSKVRRGHNHQRAHSRQHQQEQRTVGEYALHHLFNSVSFHILGRCRY